MQMPNNLYEQCLLVKNIVFTFKFTTTKQKKLLFLQVMLDFSFLKKLWCCVRGRDQNKNLVLSNELIKVELPP